MDFRTPWTLEKNDKWWEIRDADDCCVLDSDTDSRRQVMQMIVDVVNTQHHICQMEKRWRPVKASEL
jgi:hypothetical protein